MKETDFLKKKAEFPVGMAYVPWQNMEHVYENLEEAFLIGTLCFLNSTNPSKGGAENDIFRFYEFSQ